MAFVGPMAMALALAALAMFDDERRDALPRQGRGLAELAAPPAVLRRRVALFLLTTIPQLLVDSVAAAGVQSRGAAASCKMYGVVAMIPYYRGLRRCSCSWRARTRYKAPLYLYMAATLCGLAVLAQGAGGAGAAGDRSSSPTSPSPELAPAAGGRSSAMALAGRGAGPGGGGGPLAPRHAIRHGTAFWNELFGDNHWRRMVHRPPRRSRHASSTSCASSATAVALAGVRARGARLGGAARGARCAAAPVEPQATPRARQ